MDKLSYIELISDHYKISKCDKNKIKSLWEKIFTKSKYLFDTIDENEIQNGAYTLPAINSDPTMLYGFGKSLLRYLIDILLLRNKKIYINTHGTIGTILIRYLLSGIPPFSLLFNFQEGIFIFM